MKIYPAYILTLLLMGLCVKVSNDINAKNKYHLRYLFYHFVFQLLAVLNISLSLNHPLLFPAEILIIMAIFSFSFLLLHIMSLFEEKKAKLPKSIIFLFALLSITYILNSLGILLIQFDGKIASFDIIGFPVVFFRTYSDVFICLVIISVYFTALLLTYFFKSFKKDFRNVNTNRSIKIWFFSYVLLIIIVGFLTIIRIYLSLINNENLFLSYLHHFCWLSVFLIVFIKSSILYDIVGISKQEKFNSTFSFNKIEQLFDSLKVFVNPTYSIKELALDFGENEKTIRDSIKFNSNLTVPSYINLARVKYSCKLIDEGFLNRYTLSHLIVETGFTSQQNFNRAFKNFMKMTPSEYIKK